jgi:hypothetical protein
MDCLSEQGLHFLCPEQARPPRDQSLQVADLVGQANLVFIGGRIQLRFPVVTHPHFCQERIAYKYLTWAWQMDEEGRDGLTRQQFTRYYLMRLGTGHDLTRIALDPKHPRKLASEAELLALRPDLNHIE